MKKISWMGAVLCMLLCLTACASAVKEAPQLLEPVGAQADTAVVKRGDIYDMASYEFAIVPRTENVLYTADGTLNEVCVMIGQQVQKGDVLLKLDVDAVQEQLDELDAHISYVRKDNELTLAMLQLDVDRCAFEMGEARDYAYGTKKEQEKIDEYDRVKEALRQEQERQTLQMQQLNADRKALADRIANSELKAECDGRVVYIAQESGDSVRAGSTALALAVDELYLRGEYLSETVINTADEIQAFVGGKSCAVVYQPMDEQEYVSRLLSGAEMNTDFAFADGAPAGVQVGDYALVLVKSKLSKNVLYLPPNALENDAAGYHVYLSDGQGGRERVDVEIGSRCSTAVEIKDGLQEGDEVYVP